MRTGGIGRELGMSEIKPNSTYTVLNLLKENDAEARGVDPWQWGIVMTDINGYMVRDYNLTTIGGWTEKGVTPTNTWHFFEAVSKDAYFGKLHLESIHYQSRIKRMQERYDEQYIRFNNIMAHPLHKLAQWLINHFGGH